MHRKKEGMRWILSMAIVLVMIVFGFGPSILSYANEDVVLHNIPEMTDNLEETNDEGTAELVTFEFADNGKLYLENTDVKAGGEAKVCVKPKENYVLKNIAAYGEDGLEVDASDFDEKEGVFFYPVPEDGKLKITAEFEKEKSQKALFSVRSFNSLSTTLPRGTKRHIYNQGGGTFNSQLGIKSDELLNHLKNVTTAWPPYYLSTPYSLDMKHPDNRNPNGNCSGKNGSDDKQGVAQMNCTGFVWHVLWKTLGVSYNEAYGNIPCRGGVGAGGWRDFLRNNGIEYATYSSSGRDQINNILADMLSEGYIEPGDIVWTWDADCPMAQDGLPAAASGSHHIGIYIGQSFYIGGLEHWKTGEGDTNVWWHSLGDSDYGAHYGCNVVSNIMPKTTCQAITVIKTERKPGKLKVSKCSEQPEITYENSCYNLAGAEYGVYSDAACTKKVASLTTDENGNTEEKELKAGTYYVRELAPSQGYAVDTCGTKNTDGGWKGNAHRVVLGAGESKKVSCTEPVILVPVSVLLGKVDADTNLNKPQGSATLEGALFTVKFYSGVWSGDANPADLGKKETRTWVFRTDSSGECHYKWEYLFDGDELYLDSGGKPCLPLGTLTIQETKAPEGYLLNPDDYVMKLTENKANGNANSYNKPNVPENILKLDIAKTAATDEITDHVNGGDVTHPIPGAVFCHTMPDGTVEKVTTDESGHAMLKGLMYGNHMIEEIAVPDGYTLNPGKVIFEVAEDNTITLQSNTSKDKTGTMSFSVQNGGGASLAVEDRLAPYQLLVHKANEQGKKLEGAEFTVYLDQACTKQIGKVITDADGRASFEGLSVGMTYYLKETKAPQGYRLPVDSLGKPILYKINTKSNPEEGVFQYFVNDRECTSDEGAITGTKAERIVNQIVINNTSVKMPETGSPFVLTCFWAGICCMAIAFFYYRKESKDEENEKKKG